MRRKTTIILIAVAILIILVSTAYLYITQKSNGSITNFEECAAAGYPVMESYPRQCRANGQTFTEIITSPGTLCAAATFEEGGCLAIYDPVCGYFDPTQVQCITEPCTETFGNSCVACMDSRVISYTSGECEA